MTGQMKAGFTKHESGGPAALWTALEFAFDGRFSLWDALLLATAERHGCEIVLSEDMQDGARLGGVMPIFDTAI
jgi:predicted nucleic acid-binding protein